MDNKKDNIPQEALKFAFDAHLTSFADDNGKATNNFALQFYDGSINKHWYWGNLAFDMDSIKMAKSKIGVFDSHELNKRVGIGSKMTIADGKAILTGRFLDNSDAEQIKKDATEGFPFEASMSFDMDQAKIEYIQDGQETQINGLTLTGPGTVIKNTVVREVSICPFGALKNCTTEVFNKDVNKNFQENLIERNVDMSDKKNELTIDSFKADYADLHKQIFDAGMAEGEKKERQYLSELTAKFADEPAFVLEQFNCGATLQEAAFAYAEKLKAKIAELSKPQLPVKNQVKTESVDPAIKEFADDISKQPEVKDFMQVAKELAQSKNCSLTAAMKEVARENPQLHKDFISKK